MITTENLSALLDKLDFKNSNNTYTKHFDNFNCDIKVDFFTKQIIYPESTNQDKPNGIIINDRTTCNFDHPENFVVLECIDRLLAQGYRPEHIELEKRWNLGHDAKGGKADICVYNEDRSGMLLIIECKTAGKEYAKAIKLLKEDGGQLFSYWQQEKSTKWICLYASDFTDGEVSYKNDIINCSDDKNIELLAQKDETVLLYKNAKSVTDLFNAWNETYQNRLFQNLIFGDDCVAYKIGVKPLRKKDLRDFDPNDKIVNQFEEILRHNNVSDKENAFNRLIALFICKLVDEIRKSDNDVVEFQYKQGTDTYETLQDRLQRLHRDGMKDFMKEDIFYVGDDYAENLFKQKLAGETRTNAIEDLKRTIRFLKFYSNNDFSFKDVHNEELFYQNGKILVEVVQLFEKYRIVYPSKHQFLGDLFEQLLNKGFKQNEGQFFTPMPITRFIWDCLPMTKIMSHCENGTPKIIDFACGAGHFLTEAVEAVNDWLKNNGKEELTKENRWTEKSIYGIEKDYRLARVAKVSLYMNGAGEGKIIFGDGLEQYPDKEIINGTFDILTANPPYSVSAFKSHLKLKNNNLELLDKISNTGSEIETLFIERISQLLKPQGIAAVILPSSILSNDSGSYTAAREKLLQNFLFRAIVQFGSKTFGATGTNTVVLFLEKYDEPPKHCDLAKDTVETIFANTKVEGWEDAEILKNWLAEINVSETDYHYFISESKNLDELKDLEYFSQYVDWFQNSTEITNYIKSNVYQNLSPTEQTIELNKRFYSTVKQIEKEKLFYFTLVYKQNTLIISSPIDNNEQKVFLGYDWSNRKGSEGIVITSPGGKLYNPENRNATEPLAADVRSSIEAKDVMNKNDYSIFARLQDMLDFQRVEFNKAINLTPDKSIEIQSKYPLFKLGKVYNVLIGGTPARNNSSYFGGNNNWVSIAELNGQIITNTKEKLTESGVKNSNVKLIPKGTTLLSFKLSIGKTAIAGVDLYTNEAIAGLIPNDTKAISNEYLFHIFNGKMIDLENVGNKAFGKSLNSTYLKEEVKIPLPPIDVQRQIVAECEKVDEEYNKNQELIDDANQRIESLFVNVDKSKGKVFKLQNTQQFDISIGRRVLNSEVNNENKIPVYSANVFEPFGYIDKLLITDFSLPSILWGIDGDWMVNFMKNDIPFYPTDHCGVLRIKTDEILPRYFTWELFQEGKRNRFSRTNRASIDRISGLNFTVPPLSEQQKIVAEIEIYEAQIEKAKNIMEECSERKEEILNKYLL